LPTIQLAVEKALSAVTRQSVTVVGAGRTDAGVHATGQVIAFDVDWKHSDSDLLRAINAKLPEDVALQDIVQQPGFHPRFNALSRVYQYTVVVTEQRQPLLRYRTWQMREPLDVKVMNSAAKLLLGEHDFATFGNPPQGNNTVRCVFSSEWASFPECYGKRLVYRVEANAFLHRMVRRMVGMQVNVGRGKITLAEFKAAFEAADLSQARALAPPQGLMLEEVRYPATE
jgi:tRNA pseudouridine38-40 synthase